MEGLRNLCADCLLYNECAKREVFDMLDNAIDIVSIIVECEKFTPLAEIEGCEDLDMLEED